MGTKINNTFNPRSEQSFSNRQTLKEAHEHEAKTMFLKLGQVEGAGPTKFFIGVSIR